jgi:RNA polymerase-associated protein
MLTEEPGAMMTLYSWALCPYSHRCRIVIHEKEMDATIRDVDLNRKPPELALLNPYNRVPALADREIKLYESNIINEYLDERFPHPQLMPADIGARAKARLMLYAFDQELFSHLDTLMKTRAAKQTQERARLRLHENLMQMLPYFAHGGKFFTGDEFSILDVALAPLLWRLDHFGVRLPPRAAPLLKYAQRVFARPGFIASLTPVEKAMRK